VKNFRTLCLLNGLTDFDKIAHISTVPGLDELVIVMGVKVMARSNI